MPPSTIQGSRPFFQGAGTNFRAMKSLPIPGSLVSSTYYVHRSAWVQDLVQDLKAAPGQVIAVAVVDDDLRPLGLLVSARIQSRAFGREQTDRKTVFDYLEPARVLPSDLDLPAASEALETQLKDPKNHYFLLETSRGAYAGILTSRDLLSQLYSRFGRDFPLASVVQETLVSPVTEGASGVLAYQASATRTGNGGCDWYALQQLAGGQLLVALATVPGKGARAAMVTHYLEGSLGLFDFSQGLEAYLVRVNDHLHRTRFLDTSLAGFFGLWDPVSAKFQAYNLGHRQAVVTGPAGVRPIRSENPVLGLGPLPRPRSVPVTLGPGETLVLVSDGFVDQTNPQGQPFGPDRLAALLAQGHDLGPSDLDQALRDGVRTFRGDQVSGADMTVLFLHRKIPG